MTEAKKPADQFQIGDTVLYVPEGVITTIRGYTWQTNIGNPPRILTYALDCGINVTTSMIERLDDAKASAGGTRAKSRST
ncbi:hypothetical protein [Mesorhizobium sp. Z1-4]|uniref:hypothetical protein n=1 Tax=Mesorhizobium sp. Z1-4 TaxID=2448478 RepID=UPI000FDAE719|nr:hypothetical protein [Mesorhizobium sp. Z1-4]